MTNSLTVSASIKDSFFDRERVIEQIGRENAKRLGRAGAFIRRTARSSLRRRKGSSTPGNPPSVHSRDRSATLKNILFGLDGESVLIGPVGLSSRRLRNSSAQTVPELIEKGGTAMVKGKRGRYSAFPFMEPALNKEVEAGNVANLWKR